MASFMKSTDSSVHKDNLLLILKPFAYVNFPFTSLRLLDRSGRESMSPKSS